MTITVNIVNTSHDRKVRVIGIDRLDKGDVSDKGAVILPQGSLSVSIWDKHDVIVKEE
jgi:hypothetical protein